MNKTKRKIFETAMELFAEKGYNATSTEEITAVAGVAKGTLYYHFSSKEEIFNFLIEEGMNLLKNSITIKTSKTTSELEKLQKIILVQLKVTCKYEKLISLVLTEMWTNNKRNVKCRDAVHEYIKILENTIKEAMKKGEIKEQNAELIAYGLFGVTVSSLIYKLKEGNGIELEKFHKSIVEYVGKVLNV